MADETEALRHRLQVERGLRQAADAENERLQAQVEAYAEDMAALFQEQQGRGEEGMAAEMADLRQKLVDESAQREVITRLHQRSVERTRELSDQLATAGADVAKAFRQGKRAASGGGPWWRKPAGYLPIATTLAGLLAGAGGYATLAPTPTPIAVEASVDGALYGPPMPAELGGPGILVASGGRIRPLGPGGPGAAGSSGSTDPAALAATAAAGAFASADPALGAERATAAAAAVTATAIAGTPGAAAALGTTPTPSGDSAAPAARAGSAGTTALAGDPAGRSAATEAAGGANLGPTVTAFAATGTALAGIATSAAATAAATAAARGAGTPVATATPTIEVVSLSRGGPRERCRFELLLPELAPGAAYAVRFEQRQVADIVVFWSDPAGAIALDAVQADGAARQLAEAAESTAGRGVVVRNADPGSYVIRLLKRGGETIDSRVALFYDVGANCRPAPQGEPVDDAPAGGTQAAGGQAAGGSTSTGTGSQAPTPAGVGAAGSALTGPGAQVSVPNATSPASVPPTAVPPAPPSATPRPTEPPLAASPTRGPPPTEPPTAIPPTAVPIATALPPTTIPVATALPPTTIPVATAIPPTAIPVATAIPATAAVAVGSPSPPPPTATPVRPYIDCRPYLRGPSGIIQLDPLVWMDLARTVRGSWPMRATLTGPGVNQTIEFTATPGGGPHRLSLGGYGRYQLTTEANGADLDPDCAWNFQHDRYT